MDKVRYVEAHVPSIVIVGDSRVDNGFDPATVQAGLPGVRPGQIFNLGMPGADTRALYGILTRLAHENLLGPGRIGRVVLGLDENLLQAGDALGYGVYFANRRALWKEGEYRDLLASWLRLWGYAQNLKELREPAKLERFMRASLGDVDPVGGAARERLGYRPGFGGLQDARQAMLQEAGSKKPPDARLLRYFWRCLDLLAENGVQVAVAFPPLLNRDVLYITPRDPAAQPYLKITEELAARGIPMIALDPGGARSVDEFVNAGHLNNRGAQRFSRMLARKLKETWQQPELARQL